MTDFCNKKIATYQINNAVTTLFSEQWFGWKPILLVTRGNASGLGGCLPIGWKPMLST
ncbi:MAG: hypothetical protein MJZ33_05860 [Paludibacteraceae bacterium]|nr:hypothetical protein [Paludibacteraceae bacterium]